MPTADAPARQTPKALAAQQEYLAMGPSRSLRTLAKGMGPSGKSYSLDSLQRWSSQWKWVEAAQAYDSGITAKAVAIAEKELSGEAAAARVGRLTRAGKFNRIVDLWLEEKLENDPGAIKKLGAYSIIELSRHASETERLDHDQPTQRTELMGSEHVFRIIHETASATVAIPQTSGAETVDGEFTEAS